MGPLPDPETIKKSQKGQSGSKILKRCFLPVGVPPSLSPSEWLLVSAPTILRLGRGRVFVDDEWVEVSCKTPKLSGWVKTKHCRGRTRPQDVHCMLNFRTLPCIFCNPVRHAVSGRFSDEGLVWLYQHVAEDVGERSARLHVYSFR